MLLSKLLEWHSHSRRVVKGQQLNCRELAFQLADQFRAFGSGMSFKVCLLLLAPSVKLITHLVTAHFYLRLVHEMRLFEKRVCMQEIVIVGGLEMQQQAKALARRPHVVVATPGRLKVCPCNLHGECAASAFNNKLWLSPHAEQCLQQAAACEGSQRHLVVLPRVCGVVKSSHLPVVALSNSFP